MAIADLPPSFQDLPLSEAERTAIMRFVAEATRIAPDVAIIKPRRSSKGFLKIVVDYPDGDIWNLVGELVGLVHRIQDDTGVYLHLD